MTTRLNASTQGFASYQPSVRLRRRVTEAVHIHFVGKFPCIIIHSAASMCNKMGRFNCMIKRNGTDSR